MKNKETKTEEPFYKWCYGKWIRVGIIESEDSKLKKKPKD